MNIVALITHGVLTRWKPILSIVVSLFLCLLAGIALVESSAADLYSAVPEAMLTLIGVPPGAAPATMVYAQMLGFIGAIATAGYALHVGSQVIAGQERQRRLGILLATPVSRLSLAVAQAITLLTVVFLICFGLWVVARLAPLPFGLDLGEAHLAELCLALGANALFCATVSFAVGGATGSRTLAVGSGAAVLALGWLFAGLLPMSTQTIDFAELVPWYWYTKPVVLINGLSGGYFMLLLATATGLLLVGVLIFPLRDLRLVPLRLPTMPKLAGRPTGTNTRLTAPSLFGLLLGRHLALFVLIASIMFGLMGLAMGPIFQQMALQLAELSQSMPPAVLQIWGAGDMSTAAGFYWGETMGMMAPAAVILLGAIVAARLGDDERSGRLGLLLSAGATRARILATAIVLQSILVLGVAALTGFGIWCGVLIADLELSAGHIFSATLHLAALGLFIAAAATLALAAFGSAKAASLSALYVALLGYVSYVTLPMNPDLANWARLSPFYYYAAARPLESGVSWPHLAILLGGALAMLALAFPVFRGRDLQAGLLLT